MFESIVIRRQELVGAKAPIDIITFAESLLFYDRVHLIADFDMMLYLAREMGPTCLNEYIEEGFIQVSYVEKRLAIANRDGGRGTVLYEPVTMHATNGEWKVERAAPEAFSKAGTAPGAGRQLGRRFAQLVQTADLGTELINESKTDFADANYIEPAIETLLRILAPTYRLPQDYRFRLTQEGRAFRLDTNIDFDRVSTGYSQTVGLEGMRIAPGDLLIQLYEARGDLHFASRESAELATHEAKSAVLGIKFGELLKAHVRSQQNIQEFQRLVLANSHEIGESLKFGYRTWDDFLQLLKAARKYKFKDWVSNQDPSDVLINEYLKAITKDSWATSLPAKVIRFVVLQGLGAFAPGIVNSLLSAADTFLVEKIAGGWKPSRFVDGPLKQNFLRQD